MAELTIEPGTHPGTGDAVVSVTIPDQTADPAKTAHLWLTPPEARQFAGALHRVADAAEHLAILQKWTN